MDTVKAHVIKSKKKSLSRGISLVEKLSLTMAISVKYAIPFVSGLYVGMREGGGAEIEPIVKYGLLTAPTAFNFGLAGLLSGGAKLAGRMGSDPALRYDMRRRVRGNSEAVENAFRGLDEMAAINVPKKAVQAAVKPGIMTLLGYGVGYAARLSW